jgi:hypothetical protein
MLSGLKIMCDVLTAGSGILGLLTDFRDEATKRITRTGKTALVGIVVGLALSATISFLELRDVRAQQADHRTELARESHRIDFKQVTVHLMFYVIPNPEISDYANAAYNYLKANPEIYGSGKNPLTLDRAQAVLGKVPNKLAGDLYAYETLFVFRQEPSDCYGNVKSVRTGEIEFAIPPVALDNDPQSAWCP